MPKRITTDGTYFLIDILSCFFVEKNYGGLIRPQYVREKNTSTVLWIFLLLFLCIFFLLCKRCPLSFMMQSPLGLDLNCLTIGSGSRPCSGLWSLRGHLKGFKPGLDWIYFDISGSLFEKKGIKVFFCLQGIRDMSHIYSSGLQYLPHPHRLSQQVKRDPQIKKNIVSENKLITYYIHIINYN